MAGDEIVYGQGTPAVIEPAMPLFDQIVDDIKYKAQLLARETKLSSGVIAATPQGFAIGFFLAVAMMLGPFLLMGV
ncbi:MAG: tetrahydromethanopterin S-methyltransferase subunit F [Methanothrix sp.]|uniref:tetrahydromethanopterin S-methyltransferase subunit F n=1 Tax=Methanothrix sp. TaxID=90426 RepID=UPI0025EC55D8|nr:tetrahydromethanopterin S-methyltransferase subunit F [Methanothrix sp.]MCQ8902960.1 tetrahydromethanopterin S-methyltransferase subunit F [Methanothrix sp.]